MSYEQLANLSSTKGWSSTGGSTASGVKSVLEYQGLRSVSGEASGPVSSSRDRAGISIERPDFNAAINQVAASFNYLRPGDKLPTVGAGPWSTQPAMPDKAMVQAFEVLGKGPGFVMERPIALVNTAAQRATGVDPIAEVSRAVGGIPGVGAALGVAGGAALNFLTFGKALFNADIARILRENYGKPDNAPYGNPLSSWKTIGDVRKEAAARGFTAQDIADLAAGKKSDFDFGDRMLAKDPLADVLGTLALDPTNLLLMAGVFGKAVSGAGMVARLIKTGSVAKTAVPVSEGAALIAAGAPRAAAALTDASLASYLGRGVSYYRKAALATSAANLAGVALEDKVPQMGPLQGLMEFNRAVFENRPLSNNVAFDFFAAITFPFRETVQAGVKPVTALRAAVRQTGVVRDVAKLMPKLTPDQVENLVYYTLARIEFRRISPSVRDALSQAENASERAVKQDLLQVAINERIETGLKAGRYTSRDVQHEIRDWFTTRRTGRNDEHALNQNPFPWNADDAADVWTTWSEKVIPVKEVAAQRVRDLLGDGDYPIVTIGHAETLPQEVLVLVKERYAGQGTIPVDSLRSTLSQYPQLLRMDPWFEKHLLSGAGEVRVRDLNRHLNKLIKDTPSLRQLYQEFTAYERAAPPDPETIMAQAAEEEAGLGVSRWAASKGGFGVRDSLDGAMASRNHPAVEAARANIVDVLTQAGYTVDEIADAIGAWMENGLKTKEPSLHLTLNGATLAELRTIGASLVGPWDQFSTIHYLTGAALARNGLKPNGVVIRIAVPTNEPALLGRLADMVDAGFPGYELIESKGLFTIVQHGNWFDNDIAALSARVEALTKALSDEFPPDALGQSGVLSSMEAAYVESVVKSGATNAEQISARTVLRAAADDPRAAALRSLVPRTLPDRRGVVGVGVDGAVGDPALVGRGGLDGAVAPQVTRANLQSKLEAVGYTAAEAGDIAAVTDAMFRTLARDRGIPVEDFYATYLSDIVRGGEGAGLAQVGPGAAPPQWMKSEGLGAYAKDVPVTVGDRTLHIPGGLDGTFSVWDAIKLRAQKIDATWLYETNPELAVQLYNKMFRSMQRDLSDPMETFHLVTFALMSPRTDFVVNEARAVLAKLRSPEEIVAFADKYLPVGSAEKLSTSQISALGKRVASDLGIHGAQGKWNVRVSFKRGGRTFNRNIVVPYAQAATKEAAEARAIAIAEASHKPKIVRKGNEAVEYVPVEELRRYARYDRETPKYPGDRDLDDLAANMAERGFDKDQPIALAYYPEKGVVTLINGHHRLAAAIRNGITEVPVFVRRVGANPKKTATWMKEAPIRPAASALADDFAPSKLGIGMPERVAVKSDFAGGELQGLAEHFGNLALAARAFRDNQSFFSRPADMPLNHFADRLMNITRGAGLKVGTFGPMLADPITATRGTIDVYMVRYINAFIRDNQELLARMEAERGFESGHLTTELRLDAKGEPVIPQARKVKATNKAVPDHLKDLGDDVQIFEGSEYQRANDILRVDFERFKAEHPEADFDLGGYQWFVWDRARGGRLEPHVAAYPGTYKASRPPIVGGPGAMAVRPDIISMLGELKAGGMSSIKRGIEGYEMNPELMTLFQDGDVIKGLTQFDEAGRAIIRFYSSADVSTALHEVFHAGRRGMVGARLAELERLFGVRDGNWTPKQEEAAARAFERFARTGEVSNPELHGVFTRIKEWMQAIYTQLRDSPLGRSLSPEKRAFFDSLLGTMDDRAPIDRIGIGSPKDAVAEPGFLYRAATTEDLIRLRGESLRPEYSPSGEWPAGAPGDLPTGKRTHWTDQPTAFEETMGVIRAPQSVLGRVRGQAGDFYSVRPVRSSALEVLGKDGQWHPLDEFMTSPLGDVPTDLAGAAQRWAVYFDSLPVELRPSTEAGALRLVNDEAAYSRYGMATAEELAAMDAEAVRQLGVLSRGFHQSIADQGERFMAELVDFENWLAREYPQYTSKAAPKDSFLYKGTPSDIKNLLAAKRGIATWLALDAPVISRLTRFLGWLTEPMTQRGINADILAYLHTALGKHGAVPADVDKFLGALRSEVDKHKVMGFNLFRGPTGLLPGLINDTAAQVFPKAVVEKVGASNFWKEIDRAFNRGYRTTAAKFEAGEASRLERAFHDFYGVWQDSAVGAGGHVFAKVAYPFLRFIMDPRWWAMNYLEADALSVGMAGFRATRWGAKGIRQETELSTAAAMHAKSSGQGTIVADEGWLWQRQYTGYINKVFDIRRPGELKDAMQPYWAGIRQHFGDATDEQIMAELDRMLYGFDKVGVRKTIDDEAARFLSVEERSDPAMVALLDRVYEVNQKTFDNVINVLHGNPNRATLERVLNSYWLFWPLSYQLKVTKWMYDLMTYRALGKRTNLAPAYVYSQLLDEHNRKFETIPAYRAMFEDNPTLWMVGQMLLPITPGDVGVSLSRPVRYTGTYVRNFLGGDEGPLAFWGDYKSAQDPLDTINAITMFGPFYTKDLIERAGEEAMWKSLWGEASHIEIIDETPTGEPGAPLLEAPFNP